LLDAGSLQAARRLDIKLNMLLDGGSPVRHQIKHVARWWLAEQLAC